MIFGREVPITNKEIDLMLDAGVSGVFTFIERYVPLPLRPLTWFIERHIRRKIKKKLRAIYDRVVVIRNDKKIFNHGSKRKDYAIFKSLHHLGIKPHKYHLTEF